MKCRKIILTVCATTLLGILLYFSITESLSDFIILPVIIIAGIVLYCLHEQIEKDNTQHVEKGITYAIEDMEAEKWIKDTLVPRAILYGKRKHWPIIIFSFFLITLIIFFWSYATGGLASGVTSSLLACVLFWLFIFYAKTFPAVYNRFLRILPDKVKKYTDGDWGQAFIFLLPISFLIYVLYPFENIVTGLINKFITLPVFLLGYAFSFLCLYTILYITSEIRKDEKKRLEKDIKELL